MFIFNGPRIKLSESMLLQCNYLTIHAIRERELFQITIHAPSMIKGQNEPRMLRPAPSMKSRERARRGPCFFFFPPEPNEPTCKIIIFQDYTVISKKFGHNNYPTIVSMV